MNHFIKLICLLVFCIKIKPTICSETNPVNILNSILKPKNWSITEKSLFDNQEKTSIVIKKLLTKKPGVNKSNLPEKLRQTMLLVDYEYIKVLSWIVSYLIEMEHECLKIKQINPNLFQKFVDTFKNSIMKTRDVTTRFISVINFLKRLLDIKMNSSVLSAYEKLNELVHKVNLQMNNIDVDLEEIYKGLFWFNEKHVRKNMINYQIDLPDYYQENSFDCYKKYISDNRIPEDEYNYITFLSERLNSGIEKSIEKLYEGLGFEYDNETRESLFTK